MPRLIAVYMCVFNRTRIRYELYGFMRLPGENMGRKMKNVEDSEKYRYTHVKVVVPNPIMMQNKK